MGALGTSVMSCLKPTLGLLGWTLGYLGIRVNKDSTSS